MVLPKFFWARDFCKARKCEDLLQKATVKHFSFQGFLFRWSMLWTQNNFVLHYLVMSFLFFVFRMCNGIAVVSGTFLFVCVFFSLVYRVCIDERSGQQYIMLLKKVRKFAILALDTIVAHVTCFAVTCVYFVLISVYHWAICAQVWLIFWFICAKFQGPKICSLISDTPHLKALNWLTLYPIFFGLWVI